VIPSRLDLPIGFPRVRPSVSIATNGPRVHPVRDTLHFAGAALTEVERSLLAALPQAKPGQAVPMVIVTDPGFDVDDETALVLAAGLQRRGWVDVKAAVATTVPSRERALLAKGVLRQLGLGHVPVGIGLNHQPQWFPPEAHRLQSDFNALPAEVADDAQALLRQTLTAAPDRSMTVLILAAMGDIAQLLATEPDLFRQKVQQVVVMGGVLPETASGLQPDAVSTNTRHHPAAAEAVFRTVQAMDIPITVVTAAAATQAPVSPDFFADLAETGHPVARHIRAIEGDYLNKFWQSACRGQLGPGKDRAWFVATFCRPEMPATLTEQEDILPWLKSRTLYDPIALLAAIPALASSLFEPVTVPLRTALHQVIGLTRQAPALRNPVQLATLLSALCKEALGEQ
jgi:inosine-uridine nucleoside N-ribohydrolase